MPHSAVIRQFHSISILRIVLVLLVISSHTHFFSVYDSATVAVNIFFVLSGFLITTILINQNRMIKMNGSSFNIELKAFMIKRFFRIFPIYYLTLIFVKIFFADALSWSSSFKWYFTYLSNYHFIFELKDFPGMYSHLWTLAVEGQFYLIWPLIILLLKEKYMVLVFSSLILLSLLFKAYLFFYVKDATLSIHIGTLSNLDLLASGAVFSILHKNTNGKKQFVYFLYMLGICAFIAFLLLFNEKNYFLIIKNFLIAMFGVAIIQMLLNNDKLSGKGVLAPIIYLGKISYGIYLYHNFVFAFLIKIVQKLSAKGIEIRPNPLQYFILVSAITFVAAHVSWILIEKPLLSFSKRYKVSS